jgi:hypothetical protein
MTNALESKNSPKYGSHNNRLWKELGVLMRAVYAAVAATLA